MGCIPGPQVSHSTRVGTTYHWRRPRSWLVASLCRTDCWARCRFHHHFGICGKSGLVSVLSQATPPRPFLSPLRAPRSSAQPQLSPKTCPFQQGRRELTQYFRSQTPPASPPNQLSTCRFRHHGPWRERAGRTAACPLTPAREQWLTVRESRPSPEDSGGWETGENVPELGKGLRT